MGAKVGGKKGGAMADINVTPLVDVVLVLLIIFMVVTPMLSSGVDVKLPEAKTATVEVDKDQYLTVTVRNDGAVFVDRTQTTVQQVAQMVTAVRDNRPLLIKGDQAVTYRQVREVLDAIHKDVGGTDTILLATDKPKEEE